MAFCFYSIYILKSNYYPLENLLILVFFFILFVYANYSLFQLQAHINLSRFSHRRKPELSDTTNKPSSTTSQHIFNHVMISPLTSFVRLIFFCQQKESKTHFTIRCESAKHAKNYIS